MIKFSDEDVTFLEDLDRIGAPTSNVSLTAKHGYVRNLDRNVLQGLENIYKRAINKDFSLCFHCSSDVHNMVSDLYREFEKHQAKKPAAKNLEVPEPEEVAEPVKKGRPKKSEE